MALVSILTAVHAPGADYLADTISGVRSQHLPPGWDLEWIVQEDGAQPCLAEAFAGVRCVSYMANGAQLGIAATRNLALARASGDLIQVLDSDDVLLPGALKVLIPKFLHHPIHWAIAQADDLMPDGSRVPWDSALPFGIVPAGTVNEWARNHGANWPVHCAGLMMRTVSLRAIGGWVGIPNDEDVAMFAALSEMADGYNEESVTWLYRQHPGQITRTAAWRGRSVVSRRIALQRASAVGFARLSLTAGMLEFGQGAAETLEVGPAHKHQDT